MKNISVLLSLLLLGTGAFAQALADRDYADLLRKSILFFEAQACGPDVDSYSSLDWRSSCHTGDGGDLGLDLNGGWHDAGDHVKFNFPMAQAVYNLATLYVDHREQVDATGNKASLLKQLRFIGDYMVKCHPEPDKYVIQVAEGTVDHQFWQVPEEQGPGRENNYPRTVFMADLNNPNTNLACANAAAFAALSMAFRGEDDAYSTELLQHARDLYDFGFNNQASYNSAPLPSGEFNFYKDDNGFQDEIMVGAAWLFRATGEQRYRNEAAAAFSQIGNYVGGWAPAWGDHQYEAAYQMARATNETVYLDAVARYATAIANGSEGQRSPGGMWQPNRGFADGFALPISLSAASLAYRYAELVGSGNANYDQIRSFVFEQVNYALGDNPQGRSYVVDFGSNSPQITHHRAAHSPANGGPGPIDTNPTNDTHTITGALMMGPILDDSYRNVRSDIKYTEPALGNNGILTLVAVLMVQETGATDNPPPPSTQPSFGNGGRPWPITDGAILQAEDYDQGGAGVAYQDNTPDSNAGGQYRNEGVDIGAAADGANYIGWTEAGEWLEYTVNVTGGLYDIAVAMASPEDDRTLRILLGEQTLGTVDCPNSSTGFEDFQTATLSGITLPEGEQVLRLEMVDGSFNIDDLRFATAGTGDPTTPNPPSADGTVVVRAKGDCGLETMELQVDGTVIKTWNNVATTSTDYTYEGFSGGEVSVHFTNDNFGQGDPSCEDSNLEVDYVEVCGTRYETETAATKTDCCPWDPDKLFSNGNFNFGTLSCSANAMTVATLPPGEALRAYPNPTSETLTVQGGQDYQIQLYDLFGRPVIQHDHLRGKATLNVSHLQPGMYLLEVRSDKGELAQQRIMIE